MSAVRMCDRCGTMFSERAEGWGTFTGTTTRRNERTGRQETVTESLDLGPECNAAAQTPVSVKALTPSTAADRLADINRGQVPDGLTVEG